MFNAVRRTLISKTALPLARVQFAPSKRLFSAAAVRLSDHHDAPLLQGPGAPAGRTPTNFDQATGAERAEHLAAMEGQEYFDMGPLVLKTKGTKKEPTVVPSGAASRIIGCTGAPGEDHELVWLVVEREHEIDRCPECGNVFKLSEQGFESDPAHVHANPAGGHHH
ncbi:Cytochrome c oxidase subunit 4 [Linderina macrospora]|uniref:Cytochrome c oxidase subunit 4 n=1 Tax=Linderina macrospora TaxID=4868 RepID=A0ACC1J6G2_9FUNG|nr:Cytochrome c oxidase subunit 4 [Linderina macrospora]